MRLKHKQPILDVVIIITVLILLLKKQKAYMRNAIVVCECVLAPRAFTLTCLNKKAKRHEVSLSCDCFGCIVLEILCLLLNAKRLTLSIVNKFVQTTKSHQIAISLVISQVATVLDSIRPNKCHYLTVGASPFEKFLPSASWSHSCCTWCCRKFQEM